MQKSSIFRGKRSKGCDSCRKRKVKCDELKPHCSRCLKAQTTCHYRDLSELRIADQTYDVSARVAQKQANAVGHSVVPGDSINRAAVLALLARYSWPEEYMSPTGKEPPKFRSLNDAGNYGGAWSAFAYAIAACAYSHGARVTGNSVMALKGFQAYNKTLEAINIALKDGQKRFSTDTASAIGTMAFYEAIEDPTGRNAVLHENAFQRIIRLKGPKGVMTGKSHEMFLGLRTNAILNSLAKRELSDLGKDDWLTVPFMVHPKTQFDKLLDLVAELASLLENMDQIKETSQISKEALESRQAIQTSFRDLRNRFRLWHGEFGTVYEAPEYMPVAKSALIQLPKADFHIPLQFCTLRSAQTHQVFWASNLELSMAESDNLACITLLEVEQAPGDRPQPLACSRSHEDVAAEFDMATSIAASAYFCMRAEYGVVGPVGLLQPINSAISWYSRHPSCEDRANWCKNVSERLLAKQTPLRWLV